MEMKYTVSDTPLAAIVQLLVTQLAFAARRNGKIRAATRCVLQTRSGGFFFRRQAPCGPVPETRGLMPRHYLIDWRCLSRLLETVTIAESIKSFQVKNDRALPCLTRQ